MKNLFVLILFTIVGLGGVLSVEAKPTEIKVGVNEKQRVASANFTIKFLEVLEESRCPEGVDCFWAGNAKIKIELRKNGKVTKTFELNTGMNETSATYEGFEITLKALTPYPKGDAQPDKSKYQATFEIVKK